MLLQAKIALNKPYLFAISFISVVVYLAKTALNSAYFYMKFIIRPQIRRDYPLNLSILLSGGKETNQDSFSNGEWTRKSPSPNPSWSSGKELWCKGQFSPLFWQLKFSWMGLSHSGCKAFTAAHYFGFFCPESRVAWDRSPKTGGKLHPRLNTVARPIANKYREGKLKRTLKREFNSTWNRIGVNGWKR